MQTAVSTRWRRFGIAATIVAISIVVFVVGVTKVTVWAIADSLTAGAQPQMMHAWGWILMVAAILQLGLAGPIARLVVQDQAPRSRLVFDLFSISVACLSIYMAAVDGAPFLPAAIVLAVLVLWMIVRLKEGWLSWLPYVWMTSVALVLSSAIYKASYPYAATWIVVMSAALLTVKAATRVVDKKIASGDWKNGSRVVRGPL